MFPFDRYYFLLHAYDVLGRHLYGTDWTGQELMAARLDAPEVIEQKRAPFESRIAAVNARDDEIRAAVGRETKEELVAALRQESEALFVERVQLQRTLYRLPTPNDDYRRSYVAYERAEKTKAVLTEALESEAIRAQAGTGMMALVKLQQVVLVDKKPRVSHQGC
jgi:hypothetical protein